MPLYSIQFPYSFAQESSVIWNNLQFKEEEEGEELSVQIPSSAVTIDQLKALEAVAKTLLHYDSVKKTVHYLVEQWYPKNLSNLIDLIIIANFIGHEDLLKVSSKDLQKV